MLTADCRFRRHIGLMGIVVAVDGGHLLDWERNTVLYPNSNWTLSHAETSLRQLSVSTRLAYALRTMGSTCRKDRVDRGTFLLLIFYSYILLLIFYILFYRIPGQICVKKGPRWSPIYNFKEFSTSTYVSMVILDIVH